ncbi:MAG: RNA 3'-terminal phosphate cyclase [Spirochaetales bacterium]|nr:RNA 3'-terminal phosphate cyclase [Spirochaetales bacterium]
MIYIDGSYGEGGGQILRTSLGLSLVTGKAFKMVNIRSGRKKPGLLRQHLTAVNAAKDIGSAVVKGNTIGSLELTFEPQAIIPGNYHFSVGTAGSATLVLQAILPALMFGTAPSTIVVEGGTHNPFAPPFDFLNSCFLPCLEKMGATIVCTLLGYGFFPAGGGKILCKIEPVKKLNPINLIEKGKELSREVVGIVSALPRKIAEEEVKIICSRMGWNLSEGKALTVNSPGPGNIVYGKIEYENTSEVITGFGQRGVPLKQVAEGVIRHLKDYVKSGAPVGEYLTDQLLIPFALAGRGKLRTLTLSKHTTTNIEIIRKFLDVTIECISPDKNIQEIDVQGEPYDVD